MIKLTDAAKYYKELEHQKRAWEYLEENISKSLRLEFQSMYRNEDSLEKRAAEFISEFEGFEEEAYPDPIHGWNVATIGYGTTKYRDGTEVKQGDTITKERALEELADFIKGTIEILKYDIPTWNEMNLNQKTAVVSFAYNLGAHFYGSPGFKTISSYLAHKNLWPRIEEAFVLYRNPGTAAEEGLKRRRLEEAELFNNGY